MIREFRISDTEQVMKLWLTGNEEAQLWQSDGWVAFFVAKDRKI